MNTLVEPGSRMAFVTSKSTYRYFHESLFQTGISSLNLAKETVGNSYLVFYFTPLNPMYEEINHKSLQLQESGILANIMKKVTNEKSNMQIFTGPQVLKVQHLKAGFLICTALLVMSFVVFMIELFLKRSKKLR
jgi:hypothetical protein